MGNEAATRAKIDGKLVAGKALLETSELRFRSAARDARGHALVRLNLPYAELAVRAADGWLEVTRGRQQVAFELGAQAEKWAARMAKPKSLLDKLGVRPGARVVLLGTAAAFDAGFRRDLAARATVATRARRGADLILVAAERTQDLGLARLREAIDPDGAIWVVRPKGTAAISEADVMAAGKAAGLVNVKVVAFSTERTAEKFVIPLAQRRRGQ